MDFNLPTELTEFLKNLDRFIDQEIRPLQAKDDNERFFDHRREWARTDFDNDGLPRPEWEALLVECKKLADKAGFWRLPLPKEFGGQEIGNLWMSVIRDHLASKGLGLFNDLQNEHSVVGNFPIIVMLRDFGTQEQKDKFITGQLNFETRITFGLTEPNHGSDATHMETKAVRETRNGVSGWLINGEKMWTTGMHTATHCALFARTSGKAGDALGITCFLVPTETPGVKIEEYMWTFNMPTDHPRVSFTGVWVPDTTMFGKEGHGLPLAQSFVHENRIRQAASSLGAAQFVNEA
jgi:acyl-CoA dehydrogenase